MYAAEFARLHPDKPALIMGGTGEVTTYAEFEARSNQTAHLFRQLGLKAGDVVAFFQPNSATYFVLKGGAERAGLRYVCVNAHLKADEVAYIISDSESTVVVVDESLMEVGSQLPGLCPNVKSWLVTSTTASPGLDGRSVANAPSLLDQRGSGSPSVCEPFEAYEAGVADQPSTPIPDERLGTAMLYSSGTTGRPKGIFRPLPDGPPGQQLPVYEFTSVIFRLDPQMTFLIPAPLYHSAPHSASNGAIRMGATVVIMDKFDAEEFMRIVDKYRVTTTQVVPTMLSRVLRLPAAVKAKYDLSSLQTVVHGAAPCPPQLKRDWIDTYGPVLYEYYGATEGHGFCMSDTQEWLDRPGTIGKAVLGEVVILDDDGNECPPGTAGVIWFRGATNFSYKGDEERTAQAQSADGSMSTVEDVGYLDEDGYLYLTDRKTHMIISGGVNIYPQETEDLLATHPQVDDVAVIGVPNPDFGEEVKAVVIRVPGPMSDGELAAGLAAYCEARMARFKCPRSYDFVDQLPRSATGKLQKKSLRAGYWKDPS